MHQPIHIPLPTSFAIGPANAFLFLEPEVTLVDCGVDIDESWNALVDALAKQNLAVSDIRRIVVTHAHVDHMGMAARIIANSNAQLYIWEGIAPWAYATESMWQKRSQFLDVTLHQYDLPDLQRDSILNGMTRVLELWPAVPEAKVTTFSLDDRLPMGSMHWEVIYMPGHSNTQTCFYQPESGHFLAADMLLPLTPAPIMEHPLSGGLEREPAMPRLMESYDKVFKMDISQVYPGHGEPFSDHRALITKHLARIATRKDECLQLVQDGNHQVGAMLDIMYSHHPETARFSGLTTLIGYLDLLLDEGAVREVIEDGKRRYMVA